VKKLAILFGAIACFSPVLAVAQQKSATTAKSSAAKSAAAKQSPANAKQTPGGSEPGAQSNDLFGDSSGRPKGPTEITATQEAQFDTKTRTGVFIGAVKVVDPQFTLTSDRLTVHLNRDEDGGGLNDALAEGNVVIVHVNQPKNPEPPAQTAGASTQAARTAGTPNPNPRTAASGPARAPAQPTTSVGKAERALYVGKDGSITLTGWPQVTQGGNTHVATAPGVKMTLYKDGRMQTYGSTRTLIEDRTTATNNPNANGAQ
jgi:lipopolysaccharide export system protein LptA